MLDVTLILDLSWEFGFLFATDDDYIEFLDYDRRCEKSDLYRSKETVGIRYLGTASPLA